MPHAKHISTDTLRKFAADSHRKKTIKRRSVFTGNLRDHHFHGAWGSNTVTGERSICTHLDIVRNVNLNQSHPTPRNLFMNFICKIVLSRAELCNFKAYGRLLDQ